MTGREIVDCVVRVCRECGETPTNEASLCSCRDEFGKEVDGVALGLRGVPVLIRTQVVLSGVDAVRDDVMFFIGQIESGIRP